MTPTPCPSLRLVEEKMYELERDDQELWSLQMVAIPTGWAVTIAAGETVHEFHLDVWGVVLDEAARLRSVA